MPAPTQCSLADKLGAQRRGLWKNEEKRKLHVLAQQDSEIDIHCRKRLKINCDDSVSVSSVSTSQPTSQSDDKSCQDYNTDNAPPLRGLEWVFTSRPVYKHCSENGRTNRKLFSSSIIVFWGWTKTGPGPDTGSDPFSRLAVSSRTLIQECAIDLGAHCFLGADWQVFEHILLLLSRGPFSNRMPRTCIHVCRLGCGLSILRWAWQEWIDNCQSRYANENSSGWLNMEAARTPLVISLTSPCGDKPVAPQFIATPLWLRACQRDSFRYDLSHFEFFAPSDKDCPPKLLISGRDRIRILLLGFEYKKLIPPRHPTSFTFWRTAVNSALGGVAWQEMNLQQVPIQAGSCGEQYEAYSAYAKSEAATFHFERLSNKHNRHGDFFIHDHRGFPDVIILYNGSRDVEEYVKNGNVMSAAPRATQLLLMRFAGIPMFTFTWLVDCYKSGTLCRKAEYLLNDELRLEDLLRRTCEALSEAITRDQSRRESLKPAEDNDAWWMEQQFKQILEQSSAPTSLLSQALTAGGGSLTQPILANQPLLPTSADRIGLAFTHSVFGTHPSLPQACLATFILDDQPLVVSPLTFSLDCVIRTVTNNIFHRLKSSNVSTLVNQVAHSVWNRVEQFILSYFPPSSQEAQKRGVLKPGFVANLSSTDFNEKPSDTALRFIALMPLALYFGPQFQNRLWRLVSPAEPGLRAIDFTLIVQDDEHTGFSEAIRSICNLASFMIAYDYELEVRRTVERTDGFTPSLLVAYVLDEVMEVILKVIQDRLDFTGDRLQNYLELIRPIKSIVDTSSNGVSIWPERGLALKRQAHLEELRSFATDFNEIGQILCHRRGCSLTPAAEEALGRLISSIGRRISSELHDSLIIFDTQSPWAWKKVGAIATLKSLKEFPAPDAKEDTHNDNKYYARLGYYDREDPMFYSSQAALPPLEFEIDWSERNSYRSKAQDGLKMLCSELDTQVNLVVNSFDILKAESPMTNVQTLCQMRDQILSLVVPT